MIVTFRRDKEVLEVDGKIFKVTNQVRNDINGRRKLHEPTEVVKSVTVNRTIGQPYMPRRFPIGEWKITAIEVNKGNPLGQLKGFTVAKNPFSETVYGQVKIITDAHQPVDVWKLDENGGYLQKTGAVTEDYGYFFHYAPTSTTTLGCGRMNTQHDANDFARFIAPCLPVKLIVI